MVDALRQPARSRPQCPRPKSDPHTVARKRVARAITFVTSSHGDAPLNESVRSSGQELVGAVRRRLHPWGPVRLGLRMSSPTSTSLLVCAILLPAACSSSGASSEPEDSGSAVVTPPVYVSFYSHNEEGGYWDTLVGDRDAYVAWRSDLIARVKLLHDYGATLNWETDHSVLEAMQAHEKDDLSADTQGKSVLRWMKEDMGVVVDPHLHPSEYNYADIAHFIELLGVKPSGVVGGLAVIQCGAAKGKLEYTDWQATLGMGEDGWIHGKRWPEASWKPTILAQPAMIGHTLDDFSSGVWRPGNADAFYTHQPSGSLTYVGQGYPHDVLNIGAHNSGGAEILYDHAGYILELVGKLRAGALPADSIYTASIHLRDQPSLPDVPSTLEGLRQTLEALSEPKAAGRIVYLDYEGVASIWQDRYASRPSILKIDEFSIHSQLMASVDAYCWSGDSCGTQTCAQGQVCETAMAKCVPDCRIQGCPAQLPTCDASSGLCH